jgi:CMP-N-acetylneuraminic acid synthetase
MSKVEFTALMPMKAHSERVPNKNFRVIAGKPLYLWMVESLRSTPCVNQLIINTDAREKLQADGLLEDDFISIRDRRPDLCGDLVPMNKILEDDISVSRSDHFIMTHTTNPLITPQTLNLACERYSRALSKHDSLFSVTKHQSRFFDHKFEPINHEPGELLRTQDLNPVYEENSCIYIFSKVSFLKNMDRIGDSPIHFETPPTESIDIDDESDWILADAMLRRRVAK